MLTTLRERKRTLRREEGNPQGESDDVISEEFGVSIATAQKIIQDTKQELGVCVCVCVCVCV